MRNCPKCGGTFEDGAQFCPTDGSALAPSTPGDSEKDPRIGTLVDRYRLLSSLGQGGMGMVYKAEHTLIGRPVALKILHPYLTQVAHAVDRFFREARTVNEVASEHIVQVTDSGRTEDGTNFFVMELLSGKSLYEVLQTERQLDPVRTARIAAQIADGLAAAHGKGVVHRDLKPANVQLVQRDAEQDFVKILDFGIAKITESNTKLTQTGMIMGSPAYMSPEQASGEVVDHLTDIYALGVILYEMLVGTPPFTGKTPTEILIAHVTKEPEPVRARRPDVPEELERLVMHCLAKAPGQRPAGMTDLRDQLRAWLASTGAPGVIVPAAGPTPTGTATGAGAAVPATVITPEAAIAAIPDAPTIAAAEAGLRTGLGVPEEEKDEEEVERVPRRRRGVVAALLLGGVVAVAAAGGIGYMALQKEGGAGADRLDASTLASPSKSADAAVPDSVVVAAVKPDARTRSSSTVKKKRTKRRRIKRAKKPPTAEHSHSTKKTSKPDEPTKDRVAFTGKKGLLGDKPIRVPRTKRARSLLVRSRPSGAVVYRDTTLAGNTPLRIRVTDKFQKLTLYLRGYQNAHVLIRPNHQGPLEVIKMERRRDPRRSFSALESHYRAGRINLFRYNVIKARLERQKKRELRRAKQRYDGRQLTWEQYKREVDRIEAAYR